MVMGQRDRRDCASDAAGPRALRAGHVQIVTITEQ